MIETYSVDDVAQALGIKSTETVLRRCRTRVWPHHREGRRIYFTPADVEQILAAGQVAPKPQDDNEAVGQTARSRAAHASP